jgi:hypothetical protein
MSLECAYPVWSPKVHVRVLHQSGPQAMGCTLAANMKPDRTALFTLTEHLPMKKQKAQAGKIAKAVPGTGAVMDFITVATP